MKVDDLLEALRTYGLSEQESLAFYHLSKRGECTATELAKDSGLSRGDVYRSADALEQRGLIQRTMDRPQKFIPLPIDEATDRLMETERRRVETLEVTEKTLREHWPRPQGGATDEELRFQVRQGRAMIEGTLRRMVERAEREIALAAPHRTVNRLLTWGLGEALGEAVGRGVRVRILTQLTPDLIGEGSGIPDGCETRHSEVPVYAQFLIVDQREVGAYVTDDPVVGTTGRTETVLWLSSPDYAYGQQTLFDDLWEDGHDAAARVFEQEHGHLPDQLAVVRGRLARIDRVRSLAANAKTSVRLVVDPSLADSFGRLRIGAALEAAAKNGVDVQVLVPGPVEGLETDAGYAVRQGLVDERVGVLVRDDVEALLHPRPGADAEDDQARERAVLTTVPTAVALAAERFDAVWSEAAPLTEADATAKGKK